MGKNKKRLFWAIVLLLLFVPPCYYLKSSFVARKTQVEKERLLVRRQISKPFPPKTPLGEVDTAVVGAPGEGVEEVSIPSTLVEEARKARLKELEARILNLERELSTKDKSIKDWKHRWETKNKALERYKRELMVLRKKSIPKEPKPSIQRAPAGEEEMAEPEVKRKQVERLLKAATLTECEGISMSHRNMALLLCRGLRLGSYLSYDQAVIALYGVGISPSGGWNQGDPSFPIGADELEEIFSKAEKAISIGLVAADYPDLTEKLRYYCKRERGYLVEPPQCEGPMVTECGDCEISQGDFAIYLCKVLGIGETLNYNQSFSTLSSLHISPGRGWKFEEPFVLITQREIEEVRCSVREAHKKGLIETEPALMVASVNDLCLWLRMDVEVVAAGTVAETASLSDYQGGNRIFIPKEGIVASSSE
ncbi:MAG: hypothetical protein JSW70_00955 [Syntrophobacterales bacterium]|nr:MAG: hypothetical protein JSW70_00955 [Syntrophobacterales bacterium]